MACPTASNATFFGLAVSEFNAKIGWGGESTEVTATLAPTQAQIDADTFGTNLVDLGSPCTLSYEGFVYRGLLHNWEENQSMSGLTYSVRLRSPNVVLENATLILNGLDENFINCNPNLVVVRDGVDRASSYCYDFGPRWTEVYNSVNKNTTKGNHTFYHKGSTFKVDLTELAEDEVKEYKFDGDTITLMSAIERVAEAAGKRIYVDLVNTNSPCTIKIKTIDIKTVDTAANNIDGSTSSLDNGNIQSLISRVQGSTTCKSVTNYSRGIEATNNVTCAIVNGDFRKDMYESSTIYQFWGWDSTGGAYLSGCEKCENAGTGDFETFFAPVYDNPLLASFIDHHPSGPQGTYEMNIAELRAAMEGYESWWTVFCAYVAAGNSQKSTIYSNLGCQGGANFNLASVADLSNSDSSTSFKTLQNTSLQQATKVAEETKEARMDRLKALHQFVAGMSEYYGCKYLVNITGSEVCANPIFVGGIQVNENANKPDLEQTDAGWAAKVLDTDIDTIPAPFKTEDGRIQAIIRYNTSSVPSFIGGTSMVDIGEISGPWTTGTNSIFLKATVESIHYAPQWGSGAQVWALISVPPIKCSPIEKSTGANPIGLSDSVLSLSNSVLGGDPFTAEQGERVRKVLNQAGAEDLKGQGLAPGRHNSPADIVVPLKSNKRTYGPGFYPAPTFETDDYGNITSIVCTGTASDAGKGRTEYIKDTSLNPWSWGGTSMMSKVAGLRLASMVSAQHINESGSVSFVGFPSALLSGTQTSFTLGNVLTSTASTPVGPSITNISVSVGMNGVTTTVQLRTTTRNFGELAQSRIDWMSRMAGASQRLQRALSESKYEQAAKQRDFAIGASKIKPLSNNSGGTASGTRKPGGSNTGNVMVAQNHVDAKGEPDAEGSAGPTNVKETDVITGNMSQVLGGLVEGGSEYLSKAGCSMDALYRPFAIGEDASANSFMAVMSGAGVSIPECKDAPREDGKVYAKIADGNPIIINALALNPFMKAETLETVGLLDGEDNADYDMRAVLAGDSYEAMNTYTESGGGAGNGLIMPANFITDRKMPGLPRSLGLRGPVVIVGWGYDTEGFPVPNANENYPEEKDCKFKPSFLNSPSDWMAGPLDVRWDPEREVWGFTGGAGDCPVACPVEPTPTPKGSQNPSKFNPSEFNPSEFNPSENPSNNPSSAKNTNPSFNPSKTVNPSANPSKFISPSLNPSRISPSFYSPSASAPPNPSECPPVLFHGAGYVEGATQVLGHEGGCLKWFDVNDCDVPDPVDDGDDGGDVLSPSQAVPI